MSRYELVVNDDIEDCRVYVGWDNPMHTFFGYAVRQTDDGEDDIIFSVGDDYHEIQSVGQLAQSISAYAVISESVSSSLEIDHTNAEPMTDHQQKVMQLMKKLNM